ncbi:MAG: hypothetical protein IH614_19475 [Desulfuromonadales bacterium]|nr:hypothetical protein [Desulfuromonadales bacterium]
MKRFLNRQRIAAVQLTTPAENPLVTDDNRLMDVWFSGAVLRKQMFKKVKKSEQEALVAELLQRGFLRSGNLLVDPRAVLFAEMENELLGGVMTLGDGENGKPVEFKINSTFFSALTADPE